MIGILTASLLMGGTFLASDEPTSTYPLISYEVVRSHELKPHRRTVHMAGVTSGLSQLRLTLIVSPTGEVLRTHASGSEADLKYWPRLRAEVEKWRFKPFQNNGTATTVEVEEYIDLLPPERLPTKHVLAPIIRPDSEVAVTLNRTGCLGSCPFYTVVVSTVGITFDGQWFVVAEGKHAETIASSQVRELARRMVEADFYSMDDSYITEAEQELLKLGANVNARNHDGETPIFTTVDDDAILLFIRYGADLTIRNNKGETVLEAAQHQGSSKQEALRKAMKNAPIR